MALSWMGGKDWHRREEIEAELAEKARKGQKKKEAELRYVNLELQNKVKMTIVFCSAYILT